MPTPAGRRDALVDAALRLLETEGPEAVTVRRVAQHYGSSTMVVYSEFGSLGALVDAVVVAGFGALREHLLAVEPSPDPVTDLWLLALAYTGFAEHRPHLYDAMYGASAPGGHRRTGEQLLLGLDTFRAYADYCARAVAAGRLRPAEPLEIALDLWTVVHGRIMLERSGLLGALGSIIRDDPVRTFETLMTGLGDDPARVRASVAAVAGAVG
ncbi:TetR/AcrR family transcriptional regulator [Pimelobacter simplex]|uniref:TetR/AcrR family transcriptional regulator n=1 Tax=Nocardioides simplex TaxID=2045 RepID=UPI003AADF5B6